MHLGFIEIIIVGAIAAGLVLLVSSKQNRGRIARFMGYGLAIGMVAALVLLALRSHFTTVRTTQQEWRHATEVNGSSMPEVDSPAWEPTEQMLQSAVTHPSIREAAQAAVAGIAEGLPQPPAQIELTVQQRAYPPGCDVEGGVSAALRERFPQATIMSVTPTGPGPAATQPADPAVMRVRLSVPNVALQRSGWGQGCEGMIQLSSESAAGAKVASASFLEKPWAREGNTRMTMNGREFIVGWSTRAATTPGDAMQQARESAARTLHPILSAKLRDFTDPRGRAVDGAWLLSRLQAEAHPVDQFEQRIDRPSGTLWRTAVLVDATPARLEATAMQIRADLNRLESRKLGLYASIAILVALIFGLYLALNALTRGYFANRLRLLAACLLLAGVILIMLLA